MTNFGAFLFNLGLQSARKAAEKVSVPRSFNHRCEDCGVTFLSYMAYNDHRCDRIFADWQLHDGGFDKVA